MTRLLIIEDNREIMGNLFDFFEAKNYDLDAAYDGLSGLHLGCANAYDLIILDLFLPGMDGIELCKTLRSDGNNTTPIIMLTARDSIEDRITGLKVGADDYLVKPFSLEELEARIEAQLRRNTEYRAPNQLQVGELSYNRSTFELIKRHQTITLTPVLLKIMEKLMNDSPSVISRKELEYTIWGEDPPPSDALRSHIHTLRMLIDKPFNTQTLKTLHGIGYRLLP